MTPEQAGGIPLYRHVYLLLKERIGRDWPIGTQLLPEPELARELGVSRPTLRHALQMAQAEGLVVRRSGQGTFVDSLGAVATQKVTGSFTHLLRFDKRVSIEVLPAADRVESAPGTAAAAHGLGIAEPRIVRRKALLEDAPFAYMENYVDDQALQRLDLKRLRHTPLVALLDARAKTRIESVNEDIEAATATPSLARLLGVAIGAPLLRVQRLYFGKDRALVNFGTCWYRADRYRFSVKLSRELAAERSE